jgi:hypothetical protein
MAEKRKGKRRRDEVSSLFHMAVVGGPGWGFPTPLCLVSCVPYFRTLLMCPTLVYNRTTPLDKRPHFVFRNTAWTLKRPKNPAKLSIPSLLGCVKTYHKRRPNLLVTMLSTSRVSLNTSLCIYVLFCNCFYCLRR